MTRDCSAGWLMTWFPEMMSAARDGPEVQHRGGMRVRDEVLAWMGLLLFASWTGAVAAAPVLPPLEREVANPSEVIFRNGVAYIDLGGGRLEPLRLQRQNGEVVYYRMVRYDAEFGYVKEPEVEFDAEVDAVYSTGARGSHSSPAAHDIESRIQGRFEGWAGKTLFQLQNGEIWQQTDGRQRRSTGYSPRVTLTRRGFDYEMRVDGESGAIMVRRR